MKIIPKRRKVIAFRGIYENHTQNRTPAKAYANKSQIRETLGKL